MNPAYPQLKFMQTCLKLVNKASEGSDQDCLANTEKVYQYYEKNKEILLQCPEEFLEAAKEDMQAMITMGLTFVEPYYERIFKTVKILRNKKE